MTNKQNKDIHINHYTRDYTIFDTRTKNIRHIIIIESIFLALIMYQSRDTIRKTKCKMPDEQKCNKTIESLWTVGGNI